jgi:hypothetical protein
MAQPMGLLGGGFDASAVAEDEFNAWYDTEHIPERLRIQGFINAVRWIGADNPRISLAIYDLASLDVLKQPEYRKVSPENFSPWSKRILVGKCRRLCRFTCEQIFPGDGVAPNAAGGLLVSALNVAPEAETEFNAWYDTEHLPRLAALPGVLSARRFKSVGAAAHQYVALYHLTSAAVCQTAEWSAAADTAWAKRIVPHIGDRLRLVLTRYVRSA